MKAGKRVEIFLSEQEYAELIKVAELFKRSATAQAAWCVVACTRVCLRDHEKILDRFGEDLVEGIKP